jgi:hypothetical protein
MRGFPHVIRYLKDTNWRGLGPTWPSGATTANHKSTRHTATVQTKTNNAKAQSAGQAEADAEEFSYSAIDLDKAQGLRIGGEFTAELYNHFMLWMFDEKRLAEATCTLYGNRLERIVEKGDKNIPGLKAGQLLTDPGVQEALSKDPKLNPYDKNSLRWYLDYVQELAAAQAKGKAKRAAGVKRKPARTAAGRDADGSSSSPKKPRQTKVQSGQAGTICRTSTEQEQEQVEEVGTSRALPGLLAKCLNPGDGTMSTGAKQIKALIWPLLEAEGWSSEYNRSSQCTIFYMPGATDNNSDLLSSSSSKLNSVAATRSRLYRMRGFPHVIRYLKDTNWRGLGPTWPSGGTTANHKSTSHTGTAQTKANQAKAQLAAHAHSCNPIEVEGKHHGHMTTHPVTQPEGSAYHVVIVGAGTAGLSAAKTLVKEADSLLLHGGTTSRLVVTILEGKGRVGGRIHTFVMGENDHGSKPSPQSGHGEASPAGGAAAASVTGQRFPVDLGASFVHGCNKFNPVWQLAQDLGIRLDTSEGGYSEGWGRGAPWLTSNGKRIDRDKIHRIYGLYKEITNEVDRIAAEQEKIATPHPGQQQQQQQQQQKDSLDDNLRRAVDEARRVLQQKFKSRFGGAFEVEETKQILESINVLWAGFCSTLEDCSLAMSVEKNWDLPQLAAAASGGPQATATASAAAAAAASADDSMDGIAAGASEDGQGSTSSFSSASSSAVRRSERRSKLPSVAAEEEERDESDGLVVGGYGPFLIVSTTNQPTNQTAPHLHCTAKPRLYRAE